MKKVRSLVKDKRGSTLIEIIVSVLIVGIAFVPLMMSLTSSLKANQKTERELYAENVATNIAEICKAYGANGLHAMVTGGSGAGTISDIFTGATLTEDGEGKIKFEISNLTAGTDCKYTAKLVFSSSTYDPVAVSGEPVPGGSGEATKGPRQNDFSGYPSLSAIGNAVPINVVADNLNYIVTKFYDQAVAKGSSITKEEMIANINVWLNRKIEIDIVPGTGENTGKYVVNKKVIYTGRKDADTGLAIFKEVGYAGPIVEEQIAEVGAYLNPPQNIIITYKPLVDGTEYKKLYNDEMYISKKVDGKVNVYSLCENGTSLNASGFKVKPNVDSSSVDLDGGANIGFYSNIAIDASGTGYTKLDKFGGGTVDKQSKMKDVKITIIDEFNQQVLEKTATVIEFE